MITELAEANLKQMDEACSIQAPSFSCIKKNETTEVVSQKSNFEGSPQNSPLPILFFISY